MTFEEYVFDAKAELDERLYRYKIWAEKHPEVPAEQPSEYWVDVINGDGPDNAPDGPP